MSGIFELEYKCLLCGEIVKEEWLQGVLESGASTSARRDHLFNHYFEKLNQDTKEN